MQQQSYSKRKERFDRPVWKQLLYTRSCFPSHREKPLPTVDPWNYSRSLAKKHLSETAQIKLEWIIFYHTVGKKNAAFTAKHFGISRKTLHKWLKRFNPKQLHTLEEQKREPHQRRSWMVTTTEEKAIITLRKAYMEFGKKELAVLYEQAYGRKISTWKIERVIRRHKLYPPQRSRMHKSMAGRTGGKAKMRIHKLKQQIVAVQEFGFLWHIDTIIIWWYGTKRYIFTALEETTRIAFARVYTQNTSGYAEDFLKRLMYLVEGKVTFMHSDNGSEFQGAFERACERLSIQQIYSRPHTPKDNPKLEKFNGTLQKEWLDYSLVGLDTLTEANEDLTNWLVKYNGVRPHAALNYQTPLEFAEKHFFPLLPMWSAQTLLPHLPFSML